MVIRINGPSVFKLQQEVLLNILENIESKAVNNID